LIHKEVLIKRFQKESGRKRGKPISKEE